MRIGVLTGGGDVPGLNAAIRAVARRAFQYGYEVFAVKNGWDGLVQGALEPLTLRSVSGILHVGGTILGTSRTNPCKSPGDLAACIAHVREEELDALVAIGGDDTLGVAQALWEAGVKIVGIPKTMDNDVPGTDYCIGFNTAVTVVAEACDRLHTTASAHHRVMVVEVMGRYTGWVATVGGLAGGADLILIPERPCTLDFICEHVKRRWEEQGKSFSIIVVSEGAKIYEVRGEEELGEADEFGHVRLDRRDIGKSLAREIEKRTGFESRAVVLGHIQRGGSPTVFDRVLATRFGVKAVDLLQERQFGCMVALRGNEIIALPLAEVTGRVKEVDLELYDLAKVFY